MRCLYLLAVAVSLSGCYQRPPVAAASPPPAPRQHREPYPDSLFAALDAPGNGAITGQVFARTRAGDVKLCAGCEVALVPWSAYTAEWLRAQVDGTTTAYAPDFAKHFRFVAADADGRFRFDGLHPGEYLVCSTISWEYPGAAYWVTRRTGAMLAGRAFASPDAAVAVSLEAVRTF